MLLLLLPPPLKWSRSPVMLLLLLMPKICREVNHDQSCTWPSSIDQPKEKAIKDDTLCSSTMTWADCFCDGSQTGRSQWTVAESDCIFVLWPQLRACIYVVARLCALCDTGRKSSFQTLPQRLEECCHWCILLLPDFKVGAHQRWFW